jgi:hypothetical protein
MQKGLTSFFDVLASCEAATCVDPGRIPRSTSLTGLLHHIADDFWPSPWRRFYPIFIRLDVAARDMGTSSENSVCLLMSKTCLSPS